MSEGSFLWFYADLRGGRGSRNDPKRKFADFSIVTGKGRSKTFDGIV